MEQDVHGLLSPAAGGDDGGRLREAQHRIANNLAMIAGLVRLQAQDVAGRRGVPLAAEQAQAMLEEAAARIEGVARLHRRLSSDPEAFDLGAHLRETCEGLVASLSSAKATRLSHRFDARLAIEPEHVGPLSMIVSELVTNAIKYAHPSGVPGRIHVACRACPAGGVELEVADDGVGLPEGFDPLTDGGVGFRVVRALAEQMGGEISFASEGLGLTTRLTAPARRPASAMN